MWIILPALSEDGCDIYLFSIIRNPSWVKSPFKDDVSQLSQDPRMYLTSHELHVLHSFLEGLYLLLLQIWYNSCRLYCQLSGTGMPEDTLSMLILRGKQKRWSTSASSMPIMTQFLAPWSREPAFILIFSPLDIFLLSTYKTEQDD